MDGSDQGRPPREPAPSSASTKRTAGLWFDDANNVIQAGNHQFRVHRSILSARSPVLSRLFSDHTQEGIQRVDGCPVIHLPDDGEDVKNLFLAIYDPEAFEPPPKDISVKFVLGVAHLSHKYEIQHLRRRAILHLERNFPSDMDAFVLTPGATWFRNLETLLDVIVTATTINALWVLPAAHYWGTYALPNTFHASASWSNPLKMPILRDLLIRKNKLEMMDETYANLLTMPPCSGCLNREQCALHKLSAVRKLPSSLMSGDRKLHTLVRWSDRKWLKKKHCNGLCAPCASACISAYELARGNYWDKLPSVFNLPSWEELKRLREADLGN